MPDGGVPFIGPGCPPDWLRSGRLPFIMAWSGVPAGCAPAWFPVCTSAGFSPGADATELPLDSWVHPAVNIPPMRTADITMISVIFFIVIVLSPKISSLVSLRSYRSVFSIPGRDQGKTIDHQPGRWSAPLARVCHNACTCLSQIQCHGTDSVRAPKYILDTIMAISSDSIEGRGCAITDIMSSTFDII